MVPCRSSYPPHYTCNNVPGALSCLRCLLSGVVTLWYTAMDVFLALYGQWCIENSSWLPVLRREWNKSRHHKQLRLLPSPGLLEVLEMDILNPLPNTKSGNQHIKILGNQYAKLTMAISVGTVTSTRAGTILVDTWVIPYGITTYPLTHNWLQLLLTFFAAVIKGWGIKHLTTTVNHSWTKDKVEMLNRTIVTILQHQLSKRQTDLGPVFATT